MEPYFKGHRQLRLEVYIELLGVGSELLGTCSMLLSSDASTIKITTISTLGGQAKITFSYSIPGITLPQKCDLFNGLYTPYLNAFVRMTIHGIFELQC
jgi:hypothetical protein